MTSTEEKPDNLSQGRSAQALRLAEAAIRNNRLRPERGATYEICTMNLAKVIMQTHPKSPHGQLLMRAFKRAKPHERSEEEKAVRWLVCGGESPTVEAVANRVSVIRARKERSAEPRETPESIAARDGLRTAEFVAGQIDQTGQAPTWFEIVRALGWPRGQSVFEPVFRLLERDGWIITGTEPRSIRPGDRYQERKQET